MRDFGQVGAVEEKGEGWEGTRRSREKGVGGFKVMGEPECQKRNAFRDWYLLF